MKKEIKEEVRAMVGRVVISSPDLSKQSVKEAREKAEDAIEVIMSTLSLLYYGETIL